jgi:hypothetical protein
MDDELRQEFRACFSSGNHDQQQIERELFRIALHKKLPATLVMLKFYDWVLSGETDGFDSGE